MATKTPAKKNVCVSCKKPEGPALRGGVFTATSEHGMILNFWMCDPCAVQCSPGQGKITLEDPTTRV